MALHATRRRFLTGIGLAGAAGTALLSPGRSAGSPTFDTAVPAGSWPVAGRDPARTRYAPEAATPATDGRVAWQASVSLSPFHPTVTVDGDTVFAATPTGVTALDAADGRIRWRFDTAQHWPPDGIQISGGPAVAGDHVLVVTGDGILALDAASGSVAWARENPRGGDRIDAVLVGDALFLPDHEDGAEIVALDVATGGEWYRFGTASFLSPVAFVAGDLFAAGIDTLARVDPRTGDRRWRTGAPIRSDVSTRAFAGTDGVVVVGSNPLVALDTDDGTERWRHESPTGEDEIETFRPATDGERVYVSAYWAEETVAFDARTGDVVWRVPERLGDPVVAGGTVYCADGDGVTALDAATGERRGRFAADRIPRNASKTLAIAGNRLYVGFESGEDGNGGSTLLALEAA